MNIETAQPPSLQRVFECMEEDSRILDPQVTVQDIACTPGWLSLFLEVVGFVQFNNGKGDVYRDGIYAHDVQDNIVFSTNYFCAAEPLAERVAMEHGVKLTKDEKYADFSIALPFDSSKEVIRNALDSLVAAIVGHRSQLKEEDSRAHTPSKLNVALEGEDAQILVNLSDRLATSISDVVRKALHCYKEQVTQNDIDA